MLVIIPLTVDITSNIKRRGTPNLFLKYKVEYSNNTNCASSISLSVYVQLPSIVYSVLSWRAMSHVQNIVCRRTQILQTNRIGFGERKMTEISVKY